MSKIVPVWLVFTLLILALFYAFNMVMFCSLFCVLFWACLVRVKLGLFIMFWLISLHDILVCINLFV